MPSSLSEKNMHSAAQVRASATRALIDPCGKFLPALVYHDLRDRLRGHPGRARARWGAIERPNSPGKLVWVVAGATRDSVRLAVEVSRAILARRLDLSVALTFEAEYPDLLNTLGASPRIAWGYAPADYAGSMHAVWRRLLPFAVILAGVAPRPNLVRLCEACRHAVLVAPPARVSGHYERIYPTHGAVYDGANSAPATDLDVLMLPARAGSDIGRIVDASGGRGLFLWHGTDVAAAKRLFALFRGHLPDEVMLVSGPACQALAQHPAGTLPLSAWAGAPVPPDKLVLIDDPAWVPVIAADVWAAHFSIGCGEGLWQALAAGACVSAAQSAVPVAPNARLATRCIEDENALISAWRELSRDAQHRAAIADEARRAYTAERKVAYDAVTELLDRVCAWR